jgi:hypothetical protein
MKSGFKSGTNYAKSLAVGWMGIVLGGMVAGCTAFNPQGAAQQYAPNYYNAPYSSLTPQQKMQLEDHLANQSNQAWRTTASTVTSLGYLTGGVGFLLNGVRGGRW